MATYLRGERFENAQSRLAAHRGGPVSNPSGPAEVAGPPAVSQSSSVWWGASVHAPGTSRPATSHPKSTATGRARVLPVEPPLLTYVWQRAFGQTPRVGGCQ